MRQHVDRLVAFDIAQSATGDSHLVHVDYYQLVDDRLPVEALHRETVAAICRAYGRPGAPTEETP